MPEVGSDFTRRSSGDLVVVGPKGVVEVHGTEYPAKNVLGLAGLRVVTRGYSEGSV